MTKFAIRFDPETGVYLTLSNNNPNPATCSAHGVIAAHLRRPPPLGSQTDAVSGRSGLALRAICPVDRFPVRRLAVRRRRHSLHRSHRLRRAHITITMPIGLRSIRFATFGLCYRDETSLPYKHRPQQFSGVIAQCIINSLGFIDRNHITN